jgi:hypothetical protein
MTTWRMRIACWTPNATNTQTLILYIAFPLPQWLQERASMLLTLRLVLPWGYQSMSLHNKDKNFCGLQNMFPRPVTVDSTALYN